VRGADRPRLVDLFTREQQREAARIVLVEGHHSDHDRFVKHRSADGAVTAWEEHGLVCPLATDITGDVMLWQDQGKSLHVIRGDVDRESGARGPATETPLPR
jgi:hypothetical protein